MTDNNKMENREITGSLGFPIEILTKIIEKLSKENNLNFKLEEGSSNTFNFYLQSTKEGDTVNNSKTDSSMHNVNIGDSNKGINFGYIGRDVNVFIDSINNAHNIDEETKNAFVKAREELESLDLDDTDKNDVSNNIEMLAREMDSEEKNGSRVKRFYNRIKEVAPTVAAVLGSAAAIAKIVTLL